MLTRCQGHTHEHPLRDMTPIPPRRFLNVITRKWRDVSLAQSIPGTKRLLFIYQRATMAHQTHPWHNNGTSTYPWHTNPHPWRHPITMPPPVRILGTPTRIPGTKRSLCIHQHASVAQNP